MSKKKMILEQRRREKAGDGSRAHHGRLRRYRGANLPFRRRSERATVAKSPNASVILMVDCGLYRRAMWGNGPVGMVARSRQAGTGLQTVRRIRVSCMSEFGRNYAGAARRLLF